MVSKRLVMDVPTALYQVTRFMLIRAEHVIGTVKVASHIMMVVPVVNHVKLFAILENQAV
jgi:hypothetical protein